MDINKLVRNRIKEIRERQKLTQQDVANALGKTAASISDIERGKVSPSVEDIYKLSELFQVPATYFFGDDYKDPLEAEVIFRLRKLPEDIKIKLFGFVNATIDHQLVTIQYMEAIDSDDIEVQTKAVRDYYKVMGQYLSKIKDLEKEAIRMRNLFDEHFGYVLNEED